MSLNLKWIILAVSMAAFGGWACGSDSKGGDSKESAGICDESSPSFDEAACEACQEAAGACMAEGKCGTEFAAAVACVMEKCMDGSDAECAACESQSSAYASCMKNECPAAAACAEA